MLHILADSGTNILTFKYEVKDGDASPDLSYFDVNSLIQGMGLIVMMFLPDQ